MIIFRHLISFKIKLNNLRVSSMFLSTSNTYQENKIKVGKYNLNYLKVGEGAHNVLCMPGALGSIWTDFKPQVEGFDRDKFTLVAWDPPGYGKSRPPEREFPINFFEIDADTAFELMKALKIPKFSLLGWSGGAISSLILAAKYPQVVNKMVMWGATTFIPPRQIEFLSKKVKDVSLWSETMRKPMIELYGEKGFSKLCADWINGMEALFNANNGNILCTEVLKDVTCPTFILYGEKDPLVDVVHVSNLQTNIRNSRIHPYPEGKHNIHIRYAEDFNRKVQDFLLEG